MNARQLIATLGCLLIIGALCQLASARNKKMRRSGARSSHNLKQYGIALHNYHAFATNGGQRRFPFQARRGRRRDSRRLTGRTGPQKSAKQYQLQPERYKVKERPDWVPAQFAGKPDLVVKRYVFRGSKTVRVKVANIGGVVAGPNKLRLTVRRINGVPVGRMTFAMTPAIPANSFKWITVKAEKILPNAVKLKATTFRLDADATKVVAESKEKNNLRWHNLVP